MTDQEKAIVMAYTGYTMLTGEKFDIYHKYIEKLLDRPVWTHELAFKETLDEIRRKAQDDFVKLAKSENVGAIPVEWIEKYYLTHYSGLDFTRVEFQMMLNKWRAENADI